jgi:DNA helicase-2/ATP-dependent DNA helicase PcrA
VTAESAPATRPPNPEQDAAIAHGEGPVHIMAGAGTGKTFTLTSRVVRLIADGLSRPDQILALTFTNKAADELCERVTAACVDLGIPPDAEPVTVLTYHGFGNAVVSEWGGLVGLPPRPPLLSKAERWLLLWDCLPHVDFRFIDLMHLRGDYGSPLDAILDLGSRLKDELATPQDLARFLDEGGVQDTELREKLYDFARALLAYERERARRGVIDFGDQIMLAVRALELPEVRAAYRDRYRYVLVDEYQDTNYAQSVMIRLLVQDWPRQNVCVVGDIRQAIYRFRGAAPDNLVRFPAEFPAATPYSLHRNYRSTEQILAAANAVWAGAAGAGEDLVSADARQGAPVISCECEDPQSEWEWIARRIRAEQEVGTSYRDMAVLVRKTEMKRQLWRGLLDRGIPAVMTGGTDLFRTPEVRELLSYLRALARPGDNVSLAHIASSDSFGLDEAALYDLLGPLPRGRSLFDELVERAADPSAPNDLRLFLATFSRLLTDAATLSSARLVERIIGLRRGAYTDLQRANAYRFQAIAEEFSASRMRGATLSSFVAYLNLLLAAPAEEEEPAGASEEDAVQVLTVHAAKGLERTVVFVATAAQADFTLPNRRDVLPRELRHPAAGMPRREDFPTDKRYETEIKRWESNEHRLEEQRIAYVALTRAKDRLFISWHRLPTHYGKSRRSLDVLAGVLPLTVHEVFDREEWEQRAQVQEGPTMLERARHFAREQARIWAGWHPDELDPGSDALAGRLASAWDVYLAEDGIPSDGGDVLRTGIARWVQERQRVEGLLQRCLTPAIRPEDVDRRPVVEVPTTLSYSMLVTYRECSRKAYLRFIVGFPGEPHPGATGTGTAFHAAAEASAAAQGAGREMSFENLVASFREAAAEAHGVTLYTVSEPEMAMLRAFWESPDRLATPVHVEAEFYWRVGPGYLHGFIDRIQRRPDGTVELIDFKTSRTGVTEEEARSNLQLQIYALAAREVYAIAPDRLTLLYLRLGRRVSVCFGEEELHAARLQIVELMERARTASYHDVDTRHCPRCEYRLICPAAAER